MSQTADLDQLRQKVIALTDAAAKAEQKLAVASDKVATALKALADEFGTDEDGAAALEVQLENDLAAELARVGQLANEAAGAG